ncbi:DUF4407 domain-containing protein [Streptomyces sp. NPDC051956]|uniref:DUF4407 domain-containing protein n=1 Tax=Streptomyces sp. NPDC051956 TaxID=3365677 RepID=UPI0037CD2B72
MGRWLRKSVGVDEDLLSWVPADRPKFTWLGAVALSSAASSGFSLWAGLSNFSGLSGWLQLIIVLVWAVTSFNLECWLVASTPVGGLRRNLVRIGSSIVYGIVQTFFVSEMLLLKIFEPAIREQADTIGMTHHPLSLIDSEEALQALRSGNFTVDATIWLFRFLIFVTLMLPILVRLIGEGSAYDRLARLRMEHAERLLKQSMHVDTDVNQEVGRLTVQLLETEERLQGTEAKLQETERQLALANSERGRYAP